MTAKETLRVTEKSALFVMTMDMLPILQSYPYCTLVLKNPRGGDGISQAS